MAIPTQLLDGNGYAIPNSFSPTGAISQKITSSGSTIQGAVLNATEPTLVRITCDVDCWYEIGTNPTATNSSNFLGAKNGEQILVKAGHRIAVLGTSASLYVRELEGI